MSKLSALAGSGGGLVAGAVVVAVAAIGAGLYINLTRAPEMTEAAVAPPQSISEPPPVAVDAPPAATHVVEADTRPPSIDEVRVEQDGLTIIAGRAAPGSEVTVLLDGEKNATVAADAGGDFAAITTIAPQDMAQVLTLVQRVGSDEVASLDEVILAPRRDPDIAQAPADAPEQADPETQMAALGNDPAGTVSRPAPTVTEDIASVSNNAPVSSPPSASTTSAAVEGAEATADAGSTDAATGTAPDAVAAESAESSPVTVLRSSEAGVEVLAARGPDALDTIEIDTISYSAEGDVQLSGRAQTDAEVARVYVDNRPVAELAVDDSGRWRGALPDIDTGVYTLRVDEVAADGAVTSRVETPFQREDPALLVQAGEGTAPISQITVQTGNTLWAIARERYGDPLLYVQVFEANRSSIRNPDLIFPGQVFDLP